MKFYIVDQTEDAFYTAVFLAYNQTDCIITSATDIQLGFDCQVVNVTIDTNKAERVKAKLKKLDPPSLGDITLVLRSQETTKEQTAFEYIKLIVQHRAPVRGMLAEPTVIEMDRLRSKVTSEVHNMKGFLRFIENAEGILYAPYSPDNNITDLIAPHFAQRFGNQKFVIHDVKRKIAAMSDGFELVMFEADNADIYLSEYEKTFENLWKEYYKSVNIAGRPHEKQMKGYMPVRYWKFMPEKKGD
jgi:probable DNA metabolism protein